MTCRVIKYYNTSCCIKSTHEIEIQTHNFSTLHTNRSSRFNSLKKKQQTNMEFTSSDFSMILTTFLLLLLWTVSADEESERPLHAMFDFLGISDSLNSGVPRTYIRLPVNRGSKKRSFHGEEDNADGGDEDGRPYKPEENWSNAAYEHPNVYGQRWGIQYGAHQKPVVVIVPDKS